MNELLTPVNIAFGIMILSVLFNIFQYFNKPQVDLEKNIAVSEKEVDGKAALLAQQVQWEKEANEKKYIDFGIRLDNSMTLAQNHVHTVDVKVDRLIETINQMGNSIVELRTIINERIPKK